VLKRSTSERAANGCPNKVRSRWRGLPLRVGWLFFTQTLAKLRQSGWRSFLHGSFKFDPFALDLKQGLGLLGLNSTLQISFQRAHLLQ
jgi:hypothetical protein